MEHDIALEFLFQLSIFRFSVKVFGDNLGQFEHFKIFVHIKYDSRRKVENLCSRSCNVALTTQRFSGKVVSFPWSPCDRHKPEPSPVGINMFKVNNRNTRTRCEVSSKLTIKTPERRHGRRSGVFIVDFQYISHLVLAGKYRLGQQWNSKQIGIRDCLQTSPLLLKANITLKTQNPSKPFKTLPNIYKGASCAYSLRFKSGICFYKKALS